MAVNPFMVRMISAGVEDGLQNHWGRDAQRLDSAFCTYEYLSSPFLAVCHFHSMSGWMSVQAPSFLTRTL